MPKCSEDGITLVELIVVIVLLAVLGTLAVTRMGSLSVWQQDDDVRAFVNTWEFAFQEAFTRGETYRLNINIDNNSYSILREVPLERDEAKQVDYLENLRIDSQKKRLEEKINGVVLQPGYYQTGALFIKSGVNLQLDKGVTLLASPYIHHYPEFRSRIAGIEMTWPAAVINIVNEKNASVSGEGTLDCRGKVFWDK